jgi:FAD/FMN-containing dehydrogenase
MNQIKKLSSVDDLPAEFRGSRLLPGSEAYGKSRAIFNMRWHDKNPSMILRPEDEDDLVCIMKYVSTRGIPVAIRSGAHGVDGSAMPDGHLVIDLSGFRAISVDVATKIIRCGAGILLGDLDKASSEHGLVVPAGTVSSTGIAGLTLGGGVGYNMRRFGATVDSLLSCKVVTTDGRKLTASNSENADLFWALRGGGGNFAIVTELTFQAHHAGPMVGAGVVLFYLEDAKDVLTKLAVHMKTAPRPLQVIAALVPTPPMPGIPPEFYGVYMLSLVCVYTGDLGLLDATIGELVALGEPAAVAVGPAPWVAVNSMLDAAAPYGRSVHTRGGYLSALTGTAVDAAIASARRAPAPKTPGPSTVQNIWFMGGAISEDFAEDSAAFSREGAEVFWEGVSQWDDAEDGPRFIDWADSAADALSTEMRANGYVNLTTDRGPEWLRGLYGSPEKFQRLIDAKTKWDPQNLLRFNKNIKPASV